MAPLLFIGEDMTVHQAGVLLHLLIDLEAVDHPILEVADTVDFLVLEAAQGLGTFPAEHGIGQRRVTILF